MGNDGRDNLSGGSGNDILSGGKGINTLSGESGSDRLDLCLRLADIELKNTKYLDLIAVGEIDRG